MRDDSSVSPRFLRADFEWMGGACNPRNGADVRSDLKNMFPNGYEWLEKSFTKGIQWRREDDGVLEIDDAGYVGKIPENCMIVQVAYFDDDSGVVHYDSRITEKFSALESRNLRLHEDFFRHQRKYLAEMESGCRAGIYDFRANEACKWAFSAEFDSARVRDLVGYLVRNTTYDRSHLVDLIWFGMDGGR